jgi:transposase
MSQVTVYTRAGPKRSWTDEEKRALVEAAFAPGVCVVGFARQADIASSLLYRWRRKFGDPVVPVGGDEAPAFVPLMVRRGHVTGQATPSGFPALSVTARGVSVEMAHDIPPALAAAVLAALVT